jgi:hypothetical protein
MKAATIDSCMLHTPVHSVSGIRSLFSLLKRLVTETPVCYGTNVRCMLEYLVGQTEHINACMVG